MTILTLDLQFLGVDVVRPDLGAQRELFGDSEYSACRARRDDLGFEWTLLITRKLFFGPIALLAKIYDVITQRDTP